MKFDVLTVNDQMLMANLGPDFKLHLKTLSNGY